MIKVKKLLQTNYIDKVNIGKRNKTKNLNKCWKCQGDMIMHI